MALKGTDLDTRGPGKASRKGGQMKAPQEYRDPIKGRQPVDFFSVGSTSDISGKIDAAQRKSANPSR